MIKLIKKDFSVGRYYILSMIFIIPFITGLAIMAMVSDFGGVITGIFILILVALCAGSGFIFFFADGDCNGEMLFASLPIKRSKIVIARYISSFLLAAVGFGLALGIMLIADIVFNVDDPVLNVMLSGRGILGLISAIMIVVSYGLPFLYKYKNGNLILKAALFPVVIALLIQLINLIVAAIKGIWKIDLEYLTHIVNNIRDWILGQSLTYPYLSILIPLILIITLSVCLAIRFFQKREI